MPLRQGQGAIRRRGPEVSFTISSTQSGVHSAASAAEHDLGNIRWCLEMAKTDSICDWFRKCLNSGPGHTEAPYQYGSDANTLVASPRGAESIHTEMSYPPTSEGFLPGWGAREGSSTKTA